MSLGPEKIILILVVALIVFGPQRLPDIARQLGSILRELRRMQETVRDELEHVLHHPDLVGPNAGSSAVTDVTERSSAVEDVDHAELPPGSFPEFDSDDITDDGFAGPRSFS
jgi:sec-independent protein translocase protein TatB